MKAIRVSKFGGPEVLEWCDMPDPVPGAGQVVVRIQAAGVNPVETYIRSGAYAKLPALPWTPGTDGAGIVEKVGENGGDLQPGQRVWVAGSVTGTYAERAVCGIASVFPLPETVSFGQGAALGIPAATAYRALMQRGGAKRGETVLIHGATGGVGTAAVQFAKSAGLTILATGGTTEGLAMLEALGANAVFDHSAPDYAEEIRSATGGEGVDLILEMLANVNLARDLTLLKREGRVVVVGSRGPIEISPRELMVRDADIRGMILGNASLAELAECHRAIAETLGAQSLTPIVGARFPLARAADSHREVMEDGHRGKVILEAESL